MDKTKNFWKNSTKSLLSVEFGPKTIDITNRGLTITQTNEDNPSIREDKQIITQIVIIILQIITKTIIILITRVKPIDKFVKNIP